VVQKYLPHFFGGSIFLIIIIGNKRKAKKYSKDYLDMKYTVKYVVCRGLGPILKTDE